MGTVQVRQSSSGATMQVLSIDDEPMMGSLIASSLRRIATVTTALDLDEALALLRDVPGLVYLEDAEAQVAGLRIYGAPWQPWFYDWAFNLPRAGEALARIWAKVPTGVDVLLTHSPAHGLLDRTRDGREVGCELLRQELERIRPRLHVFGHIHEAYGELTRGGTRHVRCPTLAEIGRPGRNLFRRPGRHGQPIRRTHRCGDRRDLGAARRQGNACHRHYQWRTRFLGHREPALRQ